MTTSATTNRGRFYVEQEREIMRLFEEPEAEDVDWDVLTPALDRALADPFLPRLHRANFETIRAMSAGKHAPEHLARAQEAMRGMEEVLQVEGKNADEIALLMAPMEKALQSVKVLTEDPDWTQQFDDDTESVQLGQDNYLGAEAREIVDMPAAEPMAGEPTPAETTQDTASGLEPIVRKRSREVTPDAANMAESAARGVLSDEDAANVPVDMAQK